MLEPSPMETMAFGWYHGKSQLKGLWFLVYTSRPRRCLFGDNNAKHNTIHGCIILKYVHYWQLSWMLYEVVLLGWTMSLITQYVNTHMKKKVTNK
jgi:hypothetical protein